MRNERVEKKLNGEIVLKVGQLDAGASTVHKFGFGGDSWGEMIESLDSAIIASTQEYQTFTISDLQESKIWEAQTLFSYPDTFPGGNTNEVIEMQMNRTQTRKGFLLEIVLGRNRIVHALTGLQTDAYFVNAVVDKALTAGSPIQNILDETLPFGSYQEIDSASLKYAMSLREASNKVRAKAPAWSKKVSHTRQQLINEGHQKTEKTRGFLSRILTKSKNKA